MEPGLVVSEVAEEVGEESRRRPSGEEERRLVVVRLAKVEEEEARVRCWPDWLRLALPRLDIPRRIGTH